MLLQASYDCVLLHRRPKEAIFFQRKNTVDPLTTLPTVRVPERSGTLKFGEDAFGLFFRQLVHSEK
jgi:hypothetical protein